MTIKTSTFKNLENAHRMKRYKKKLCKAIKDKKYNAIQELLSQEPELINLPIKFHFHPYKFRKDMEDPILFIAIEIGDIELIKLLLDRKVNVNTPAANGDTPLIMAVKTYQLAIVNMLLPLITNIDAIDQLGFTALSNAIIIRDVQMIELLLNKNANVNTKSVYGDTPLLLIIMNSCYREDIFLKVLVKSDEINPYDKNGYNVSSRFNGSLPLNLQSHYFCEAMLRKNFALLAEISCKFNYSLKQEGFINYLLNREIDKEQALQLLNFIDELEQRVFFNKDFAATLKKIMYKMKLNSVDPNIKEEIPSIDSITVSQQKEIQDLKNEIQDLKNQSTVLKDQNQTILNQLQEITKAISNRTEPEKRTPLPSFFRL